MTPDQFATALAEFAPDDTKVIMSSTTDTVVFSAIPRSKDSDSLPERHFSTTPFEVSDEGNPIMRKALETLFPEQVAKILPDATKETELTAAEEKSKERVAEKIHDAKPEFASKREEKRVTSQRNLKAK